MNEISTNVGEDTSVCAGYIKNLIMLGIIKKRNCLTEKNPVGEPFIPLRTTCSGFGIVLCRRNTSLISRGAADLVYQRIAPELPDYMGGVFEEICRQYLWRLLLDGKCAVNFTDLGRWWGTNPRTHRQEEIDIMGTDKNTALFGECKWKNEKIDRNVLEVLVGRSNLFHFDKKHFYLFSKSGFTKACMDEAAEIGNVYI